jgi:hypothetical protein
MFLKIAMSLLKIEGLRTKFLVKLPISPHYSAYRSRPGLIAYSNPGCILGTDFLIRITKQHRPRVYVATREVGDAGPVASGR